MSATYWCELAWLGGDEPEAGVVLTLERDRFASVESGVADPPAGATTLPGLTLPGLANAHSHAFHRALRSRTHAGAGTFWTWREQMYALAGVLDPDRYHALARATFAEMALAGITVVGEFHYLHHGPDGAPYADANAMGWAVLSAAVQAGIRITLLDTCYLRGGFEAPLDSVQRRFADADVTAWARRTAALETRPTARIGAAAHSVRALGKASLEAVVDVARERAWVLHAHVSEQAAENEACLAAYGVTPTELLAQVGAPGMGFTAVHATHVTDRDVALLGRSCCCLCPTTERDLADGIGPARALRDAGATLALGTDSNAVIDILEEARAVELDERLISGERGRHTPADLLRAATSAGYESLGWPEGGRLEAGALADFTTLALDGVRLAGTAPADAIPAAMFAATAGDVRDVVVGGREVVRDGAHVDIDVAAELDAAIRAAWA
ncbi:MAG: formimidoylglutamate deiminase [Solirubrobacterales bacterium]|nr:formimidoylglutamate deiminase [Solirubrobacterales bacterium]